jgi:hypothetical protein
MSSSMNDTKKLSRQGGNPRPSTYVIMYCTVEIWCLFMKTTCCLSFQGNLKILWYATKNSSPASCASPERGSLTKQELPRSDIVEQALAGHRTLDLKKTSTLPLSSTWPLKFLSNPH